MMTKLGMPFFIFIVIALTGCATSMGSYVSGRVINAETNQPLPNVAVAIEWEGPFVIFPDSHITCVGVDSAITDIEGQYKFWPWIKPTNPLIGRTEYHIAFHKKGFERNKFKPFRRVTKEEQHQMVPFRGSKEERFGQLVRLAGYTSCYGHSEEGTLPFLRSLYDEAREIATSKDDLRFVNILLKDIEAIEFGDDEANRRWDARQKELESKTRGDLNKNIIQSPNSAPIGVVPVEIIDIESINYTGDNYRQKNQ